MKLVTEEQQKLINRMTNWQNSQWKRAGAKPEEAEKFLSLKKEG